jgi:hypothetical protein
MSQEEQTAITINRYLHRFPLVLDILEEIRESRHVGDEDLETGSIRAIHSMLERLRKIEPAEIRRNPTSTPSVAEQIAGEWLLGNRPRILLPSHLVEDLESLVFRLLPTLSMRAQTLTESHHQAS